MSVSADFWQCRDESWGYAMRDDKHHGHHHKPAARKPLWLLTLGAFGLLALIGGGIVAIAFLGEGFLARPPGDGVPVTAPTPQQERRDGPVLPIGR